MASTTSTNGNDRAPGATWLFLSESNRLAAPGPRKHQVLSFCGFATAVKTTNLLAGNHSPGFRSTSLYCCQ